MRHRLLIVTVALAIRSVAPAVAQVSAAGPLTLEGALDLAVSGNPTIVAARLRAPVLSAGLDVARERLNPEATLELTRETPRQALGVAWPIELAGKRGKRIAVGEAAIRSGEAELAATIAQVRADVRRAYYDVLVADARLRVLEDLSDLAQRARNAAQARFDAGDTPRLEVLQADLALGAAQNDAAATEGLAHAARARLNALLGQPVDAPRELAGPLFADAPIVTSAVLDLARTRSTELSVLDRRIDEQRSRLVLSHALRTPDVVPSAGVTHDAMPEFTYGWRAGLAVVLPVLSTHKAGVMVEQATLDQLIAERQAIQVRITGDVTAAAASAEAQRAAYARYRDVILPQAQQVERLAQDSYQLGQTGMPALLQSLQAARDLRLRSIDTVAQFQGALADLERAIGAPLP